MERVRPYSVITSMLTGIVKSDITMRKSAFASHRRTAVRRWSDGCSMEKMTRIAMSITVIVTLLCAGFPLQAQGQKFLKMAQHADSLMTERYRRGNIDTMYITRPLTKWTVTGRLNVSGATLGVEGMDEGSRYKTEMNADYKSTLSVAVNYLGVSLSLALNPAKMMGKYKDYEVNLGSYGNRWGFDFIYQDAQNFKGWSETEGAPRIELPPEMLTLKSLNVNVYYAFNHRRFSYPAAFTQGYIQRRSAGSFMLAVSGQGQKAVTKSDYESVLKVTNIGIGAGYGYNWVPSRHWLLHLSALPTFIVYSNTSLKVNNERTPLDYHFPEVIITARGAVVRQFGNMFAGVTMIYNFTNIGDRDKLSVQNTKWRTRLLFGVRF